MRQVVWADSAREDYLRILRHIAADDPDAADHVVGAIDKTGGALADFATGHPGRVAGTYEKSVARFAYIIAYALSGKDDVVTILHVIHTSRDWQAGAWPE